MQLAGIGGGLALAARHVPCYDALVRMRADVGDVVNQKRKKAANIFLNEQGWRNVHSRAQLAARGNATADAKWAREVVTCGWPRGSMVKRVVLASGTEPDTQGSRVSTAALWAGKSKAWTAWSHRVALARATPRRRPKRRSHCLRLYMQAPQAHRPLPLVGAARAARRRCRRSAWRRLPAHCVRAQLLGLSAGL